MLPIRIHTSGICICMHESRENGIALNACTTTWCMGNDDPGTSIIAALRPLPDLTSGWTFVVRLGRTPRSSLLG